MATNNKNIITVKDIHFYWSFVNTPQLTKNAKDKGIQVNPEDLKANSEWVVKAAIPEATYKKLKKKFPNCTNFNKAKDYDLEDFEKAFHSTKSDDGSVRLNGDMPNFGEGVTDLVLVKFAQKSRSAAGKDMFPPKLVGIKGGVQDNNGVTIDADTNIGNGTKGHLQLRSVDFGENGTYLYPNAVCITDLNVWVSKDSDGGASNVDMDAFGIEELDSVDLSADIAEDEFDDEDDMF